MASVRPRYFDPRREKFSRDGCLESEAAEGPWRNPIIWIPMSRGPAGLFLSGVV